MIQKKIKIGAPQKIKNALYKPLRMLFGLSGRIRTAPLTCSTFLPRYFLPLYRLREQLFRQPEKYSLIQAIELTFLVPYQTRIFCLSGGMSGTNSVSERGAHFPGAREINWGNLRCFKHSKMSCAGSRLFPYGKL